MPDGRFPSGKWFRIKGLGYASRPMGVAARNKQESRVNFPQLRTEELSPTSTDQADPHRRIIAKKTANKSMLRNADARIRENSLYVMELV